MGKYTPVAKIVIEFDGDQITFELDRLSYADALAMRNAEGVGATDITRKYVKKMEGLIDAAGQPISIDVIFKDFYFAPLVRDLTTAVLSTGAVPEGRDVPFVEK